MKNINVKIFSINTELNKFTGVQKVLMDIHNGIRSEYEAKIVGTVSFSDIDPHNKVKEEEYIRLRNPFVLRNSVILVHERLMSSLLFLLNYLLFLNLKIIYIHHSLYSKGNKLTFLPKNIVAISDRGIKNLTDFFRVPPNNITKIHNGIRDEWSRKFKTEATRENKIIKVLFPARINSIKQQVEFISILQGRLNKNIQIIFAGIGPDYNKLVTITEGDTQFKVLGFVEDMVSLMDECDYVILFSTHEGLSISLIEATMCGKPVITNDVGGNLEIITPNESAFIASDWDDLISILNNLPYVSAEKYNQMSLKSRKEYEEKFQYEKMVEKYKCLIDQIINEHK